MLSELIEGFHVPPVAVTVRRPIPLSIAIREVGISDTQTVLDSFIFVPPRCLRSEVHFFVSWINTRVMVAILTPSSVFPAS